MPLFFTYLLVIKEHAPIWAYPKLALFSIFSFWFLSPGFCLLPLEIGFVLQK